MTLKPEKYYKRTVYFKKSPYSDRIEATTRIDDTRVWSGKTKAEAFEKFKKEMRLRKMQGKFF